MREAVGNEEAVSVYVAGTSALSGEPNGGSERALLYLKVVSTLAF